MASREIDIGWVCIESYVDDSEYLCTESFAEKSDAEANANVDALVAIVHLVYVDGKVVDNTHEYEG